MPAKKNMNIGLYPGTFDPITNGHLDVIVRASKLVDKVVIGVACNQNKSPLFSAEERVHMVSAEIAPLLKIRNGTPNIEVMAFDNLLVHFAHSIGASVIIRGLRAVSDFEYEIQMSSLNKKLCPELETIFLPATDGIQFISSTFVKEVSKLGGDIRHFVSEEIAVKLEKVMRNSSSRKKVETTMREY
ncbi:MAG: pantetheine-phosphate adenylyltransferase [Alphaproteobacteria bacterium]|nr:pantetheine-phosphate adenylyltransferase [Alphaproteobacteria bacterium]